MNTITKLVLLLSSTFNKRDEKRFGIDILQSNGFEVEVWDFTPFLQPERYKQFVPDDLSDFEKLCIFHTRQEALAAISNLTINCMIICLLNYEYDTFAIYKAISHKRVPYCLYSYNFPIYSLAQKRGVINKLSNLTFNSLLPRLINYIPYKLLGIRAASVVIALGGHYNLPKSLTYDHKTHIINAHNSDYDVFLEEMQRNGQIDHNCGVFLDQCFPSHPDAILSPVCSIDEYYPLLCRFFDYLERAFNVHIQIAAHPRSNYEEDTNLFGGRKVIFGKTAEMVKNAGFVILHDSASINYAVLFNKPMIFITTDRLQQMRGDLITYIASMFCKVPINLNNTYDIDFAKELIVDLPSYKKHRNTYIKKDGTEDTSVWQLFINYIRSNNYQHQSIS